MRSLMKGEGVEKEEDEVKQEEQVKVIKNIESFCHHTILNVSYAFSFISCPIIL